MTYLLTAPITMPAMTADLTTSVGDQLGNVNTLALIVFVAAIPLAFYVIRRLIGLIPKGK